MRVRTAAVEDAAVVAELLHDFNTEYETPSPGPAVLAERLREHLAGDALVALLAGEPPVALALLTFRPTVWDPGPVAMLEELYVRPALRGRGIGSTLLDAVVATAGAHGTMTLEVTTEEGSTGARRFYERHGFANAEPGDDDRLLYYWRRLG